MRFSLAFSAALLLSLPFDADAAAFGEYNREPMSKYDPHSMIGRLGRAVGRLDILTDKGSFPCTAFLVEGDRLVVARQCIPGVLENSLIDATEIKDLKLILGYVSEGVEEGTETFDVGPEPLETNEDGHFSVLQVLGKPTAKFGFLRLGDYRPAPNTPLWVIGHPLGKAQHVSREECRVLEGTPANGDLLHGCDTMPGDSSAPLIDPATGLVVGMHYAADKQQQRNMAKPMTLILKHSTILKAASAASSASGGTADRLLDALLDSDPNGLIEALETVMREDSDPALRAKARSLLQKLRADMPFLE